MPHATMDRETERLLAERWLSLHDPEARAKLVAAQKPAVARIARRYRSYGCSLSDLEQEGTIGLLRAIDRYDPQRGVRLLTYSRWWIKAYILRFIEHNSRLVRGTTTAERLRLFYQLGRTREELAANGEFVTTRAVADALGVSEQDVTDIEQLQRTQNTHGTLAAESTAPAIDRVADAGPSPESMVGSAELGERLDEALVGFERTLSGRALEMFRDRVTSEHPASLQELGDRWGVTRATVRRLEGHVSRPLRRHLYRQLGDSITAALGPI